jgi:hypothetical protein
MQNLNVKSWKFFYVFFFKYEFKFHLDLFQFFLLLFFRHILMSYILNI